MKKIEPATGRILSVNISTKKGCSKKPVAEIELNEMGIIGDAHAGAWHRQISLLSTESIKRFGTAAERTFAYGDFAENITTDGIDILSTSVFDRFTIGDVELEVTQLGKKCHGDGCAIYQEVGKCVMPRDGIFCRVLRGGKIKADAPIHYHPRPLEFQVITLSDRAYQGVYKDLSGARVQKLVEDFFAEKRWRPRITREILPDDADRLQQALVSAKEKGVHIIITTGGTGIGTRDITPDVVTGLTDKLIPGIMEHIRVKFGTDKPNALLSRSVAAVLGKTLVYTLPGSVRAVDEYMGEITKSLEHTLYMLHNLDTH
ncbi:MAG: molybdenum cofactor synthesis protein [Candidatus Hydrogenedentes bacterium]|nr:molybdenum cofactor synthesis protein [Candidatus Hydrogenedentota bacterium]